MSKPFAWSYSSLTSFETCPWRWKLTKWTKEVSEPQTEATMSGNRTHQALEKYVKNESGLVGAYAHLKPLADRIKAQPGLIEAERKIALRADFTETTYFAKDVWFRGVFDIRVVQPTSVTVLDWKTGKRKFDGDQLKLFAGVEMKINKVAEEVRTGYVWLQEKKIDRETFTRADEHDIWAEFSQRAHRIEQAIEKDQFPKRPSGLCRAWCPVGAKRCEHCGS